MRKATLRMTVWGLAGVVALLLAASTAPPARAATTWTVDDGPSDCLDGGPPDFASLGAAIAAAGSGDTIRVCAGDYTQTSMSINGPSPLTITGPGDTPENDGVATIHHNGGFTTLFDINADNVRVSGLNLDLTPPGPTSTSGFEVSGDNVTVANNEIANANSAAISVTGTPLPTGVVVDDNYIHDNGDNVVLYCDLCQVTDNTIAAGDTRGIDFHGENGVITGNTITNARTGIRIGGTDGLVAGNTVTTSSSGTAISVAPENAVVRDNTLHGASGTGIDVYLGSPAWSSIDVEITQNSLTDFDDAIRLQDIQPEDGYVITALIGGSLADANTFRFSGRSLGDLYFLLDNDSPTAVDAEYNDWGLCTEAEIAQEVNDQGDDSSLGAVDFVPFIEPDDCEVPHRSTATPAPTATTTAVAATPTSPLPTAAATPLGGAGPVVVPPSTGDGPSSGGWPWGSMAWLLAGAAGAAGVAGGFTRAFSRVRRH